MFTQDFDLFHSVNSNPASAPLPPQSAPQASPALTLLPSFSPAHQPGFHANPQAFFHSAQAIDNTTPQRLSRPPVPLFHSPSANQQLPQPQNIQQFQNVQDYTMGGEINVAYDGTFGDLSSTGNAQLFDLSDYEAAPNAFHAVSGNATNAATVSPKDLFGGYDSVPPSSTFTDLTTPGSVLLDTPDEYQTSPMFDNIGADNSDWFSLFPNDEDASPTVKMERSHSNQILVHPGGESTKRPSTSAGSPQAASTPYSPATKHSTVAGVSARRRDKPLPPIIVNDDDPVALKRARNTAAARKSRAKKVAERDGFESQITKLQTQVEYWKQRALAAEGGSSSE